MIPDPPDRDPDGADDVPVRAAPHPRTMSTVDRGLWALAAAAGLVALVAAVLLPVAPVLMSTPEVRWPVDPQRPSPTMLMLTAYEPATFDAGFSCRTARTAGPDGLVLATMAPGSRDLAARGLEVRWRGSELTVTSSGDDLFTGPLPAGDCTVAVTGDAAAMAVAIDGRTVSVAPTTTPEDDRDVLPDSVPEIPVHTPLPEVDALVTGVTPPPGATAGDLSVRMVLDDAYDTTPAPLKWVLLWTVTVALVVGAAAAVAVSQRAHPPRAGPWHRAATRLLRRFRPRVSDAVVVVTLAAWTVLAPMTDDDGYYSAMAANVPNGGYVANYYQLFHQGFTPFSWVYRALSWWQETAGTAPVLLRLPATALGVLTWVLIRSFVARAGAVRGRTAGIALRTVLAAAFLAWWLPYDTGVRPEPMIAALLAATLVAVCEGLERRRLDVLGLAVGLGAMGAAVAPTGFVTLAPLLVAAPSVWRAVRAGAATWSGVALRWVVLLAPGSVGLVAGFADGSWRDFVRSQQIFAPIQRARTWYEELDRYAQLIDTTTHFGSYDRRAAVLVCLLALIGFLLTAVAARVRDLPVPPRLLTAGWSTMLAFALLLPTPSNPTHHFGAFAGLGAAFLALLFTVGPGLVRELADGRRRPTAALLAAAAVTALVVALTWHGRHLWPFAWGLGMPTYGEYPTLGPIALDQPLWWLGALVAVTAGVLVVTRWRGRSWRRVAPALAIPVVATLSLVTTTAWTLDATAGAAQRTAGTWSPQADAWVDPLAHRCGAAQRLDVLDPAGTRPLTPVLPAPTRPDDAFVPGGWLPTDPPPALPEGAVARGSFRVPTPGADADARTGTTASAWFALPAEPGTELAPVVAVSGRTTGGVSLRAEYARTGPAGPSPLGDRPVATGRDDATWSWVPLTEDAGPPPGADVVRLVADDRSRATGGWLAFSDPVARPWTPLTTFLPAGAPVGVEWTQKFLFPCVRQPVQRHGVTEPAVAVIGDGRDPDAGLAGWTFDPDRGGLLGHAVREARVTPLTVRFRGGPGPDDEVSTVQVYELRQPYPGADYEHAAGRTEVSGLG